MNYSMQKQGAHCGGHPVFVCPGRADPAETVQDASKVILLSVLSAKNEKSRVQIVGNQV
jgi:hypothetical protein